MAKLLARLRCLVGGHSWEGCVCQVCATTRHEWKFVVNPDAIIGPVGDFMDEMHNYRQRCTRCGKWKDQE